MTSPRIDPDKLLELCRKRHTDGGVTLSWAMMLQIIDQLREYRPPARIATAAPVTEAMAAAAADTHMPLGDMRAALEMALSVHDNLRTAAEQQRDDDEEAEAHADEWADV